MGDQNIFKRYEIKYLLTRDQFEELKEIMKDKTEEDEYGKSTICSLYYDTPDYRLIRKSIEKPIYKEKLRVRSYGVADSNSKVYVELKKKYDGVVYKRRVQMQECEMESFLLSHKKMKDTQIEREITYCLKYYQNLHPVCLLSYSRIAYYGKENPDLRITFDDEILWRDYDLDLKSGIYGEELLPENVVLMEIKVKAVIPMWLIEFLSKNHIYKTSFSKYGTAYKNIIERNNQKKGNKQYA